MQKNWLFCSVLLGFGVSCAMEPFEQDEQLGLAARIAGCLCFGPVAACARRLFYTVIPCCARDEREYVMLQQVVIDDADTFRGDAFVYPLGQDTKPSGFVRQRR